MEPGAPGRPEKPAAPRPPADASRFHDVPTDDTSVNGSTFLLTATAM